MRTVALLLGFAAAALAQEAPFLPESVALMPGLSFDQRQACTRAIAGPLGTVGNLGRRLAQIDGRLREKIETAEADTLRAEAEQIRKRIGELFQAAEQGLREAGLDDAALARLKAMPRGALREERYGHRVALEIPDLSGAQRSLLLAVVSATDAGQRALLFQRNRIQPSRDGAPVPDLAEIHARLSAQIYEIDKRFWTVVAYALTPPQRKALRTLLPPRYAHHPDPRAEALALEGLEAGQAGRIHALFTEHESETAADTAEMRRNSVRLRDPALAREERQELQRRNAEAETRIRLLREALGNALRTLLTPAQLEEWDSLPPMMSTGERGRHPSVLLEGVQLTEEQGARLRAMGVELERAVREVRAAQAKERNALAADIGPESPQQMMMEMMDRQTQGGVVELLEAAGRMALLEVLTPDQVGGWVVAPRLES
ncbi:MAG: hypothetical protein ACT4PV_10110 [Planctomycetaceae bacterium]